MGAPAEPDGFHERLASGRRLVGTLITLPGCAFAELVARSFDYVCVDLEHGALGPGDLQDAVIGAQGAGAAALARVPVGSPLLTPALDCGVDGIVAPMVDDANTARAYAQSHALPARGQPRLRTAQERTPRREPARPDRPDRDRQPAWRTRPRSRQSNGVDALLVGTSDLSFDLGVPLALEDERLRAAVAAVRDAARGAGLRLRARRAPRAWRPGPRARRRRLAVCPQHGHGALRSGIRQRGRRMADAAHREMNGGPWSI